MTQEEANEVNEKLNASIKDLCVWVSEQPDDDSPSAVIEKVKIAKDLLVILVEVRAIWRVEVLDYLEVE